MTKMQPLAICAFFAAAAPVQAEPPLTVAEFIDLTTGHTFDFSVDGVIYGREHYMPGGQVIWSNLSGPCEYGRWSEQGGNICFTYDRNPDVPKCWEISAQGNDYQAQFKSNETDLRPYTMALNDAPLQCTGPEVGA